MQYRITDQSDDAALRQSEFARAGFGMPVIVIPLRRMKGTLGYCFLRASDRRAHSPTPRHRTRIHGYGEAAPCGQNVQELRRPRQSPCLRGIASAPRAAANAGAPILGDQVFRPIDDAQILGPAALDGRLSVSAAGPLLIKSSGFTTMPSPPAEVRACHHSAA